MKIRTVKKALKAYRDERRTPLHRKVRLSHVAYFAENRDKQKHLGNGKD